VRRIVSDILTAGRRMREAGQDVGRAENLALVRELRFELRGLLEELERIGCSYKDWSFDLGLVDFPAEIEGEEVLLCWRSDEERVAWYHTPDGGFAGRRPIPPALLGESGYERPSVP
jgi:hypothetical protein